MGVTLQANLMRREFGIVLILTGMTATFRKVRLEAVQFGLCLLVGVLSGRILLLDAPFKWQFAFLAALGTAVLMLVVGSPKRVILFILAFTVPVYFGKAFITGASYSLAKGASINLSDVLAVLLLLFFLAKLARQRIAIRVFPWTTIPALVWLTLSSVSLVAARDGQLVVIQLINMAKLSLLCWVVASSIEDKSDVTFVITGMMLGMLFQALVGAYQGITGHPVGLDFLTETAEIRKQVLSEGLVNRVQGTLGHPNSYAMYLTTVMPFALALLFSTTRPSLKILAGISLCLGGVALIFSLSRSGWTNFLVIISIVLALAVRRKRISLQAAVLVAGTTSLILLGLAFFGPDIILSRLTSANQASAHERIALAQTALAIIEDHPWVGVGLNNYNLVIHQYDTTAYASQFVVHNAFLLIAAETGPVGLTAYLGFLAILLIQAWRIISRAPDDMVWVAGVGIFSAFVALTLHSMTDYALLGSSQVFTQFWLLAGLTAALVQRIDYEKLNARRAVSSLSTMAREFYTY